MEYDNVIADSVTSTILLDKNEEKILKLFPKFTCEDFVEKEFKNALLIKDLDFNKAQVYGRYNIKSRLGIIYEYIKGPRLTDLSEEEFLKGEGKEDIKKLEDCSFYLSSLHKKVLKHKIQSSSSYKDSIRYQISSSTMHTKEEKQEGLKLLNSLPEGENLCHGDFHVGNVIVSGEGPYLIDFADVCKGPPFFDIARCYCMTEHKYGFHTLRHDPKLFKRALKIRSIIAEKYLEQMNTSWEQIEDYYHLIYMCKTNHDRSICGNHVHPSFFE
jgi:uncharacterized protein (TIGR02172 family)